MLGAEDEDGAQLGSPNSIIYRLFCHILRTYWFIDSHMNIKGPLTRGRKTDRALCHVLGWLNNEYLGDNMQMRVSALGHHGNNFKHTQSDRGCVNVICGVWFRGVGEILDVSLIIRSLSDLGPRERFPMPLYQSEHDLLFSNEYKSHG